VQELSNGDFLIQPTFEQNSSSSNLENFENTTLECK
jgi:hypothetical protein